MFKMSFRVCLDTFLWSRGWHKFRAVCDTLTHFSRRPHDTLFVPLSTIVVSLCMVRLLCHWFKMARGAWSWWLKWCAELKSCDGTSRQLVDEIMSLCSPCQHICVTDYHFDRRSLTQFYGLHDTNSGGMVTTHVSKCRVVGLTRRYWSARLCHPPGATF